MALLRTLYIFSFNMKVGQHFSGVLLKRKKTADGEQQTNSQPLPALVGLYRHNIDDVQHIVGRFYRSHNFYISPLKLPRLFLIV